MTLYYVVNVSLYNMVWRDVRDRRCRCNGSRSLQHDYTRPNVCQPFTNISYNDHLFAYFSSLHCRRKKRVCDFVPFNIQHERCSRLRFCSVCGCNTARQRYTLNLPFWKMGADDGRHSFFSFFLSCALYLLHCCRSCCEWISSKRNYGNISNIRLLCVYRCVCHWTSVHAHWNRKLKAISNGRDGEPNRTEPNGRASYARIMDSEAYTRIRIAINKCDNLTMRIEYLLYGPNQKVRHYHNKGRLFRTLWMMRKLPKCQTKKKY